MDVNKLEKLAIEEPNYDLSKLDKTVYIGDQLTTDIFWGNINGMSTVWVTDKKDTNNNLEVHCKNLNIIEKKFASEIFE